MSVINEEQECLSYIHSMKSLKSYEEDLEISPSHDSTIHSKMISYSNPINSGSFLDRSESKSITQYKQSSGSQMLRHFEDSCSDALKPVAIICDSQLSSSGLSFNMDGSEIRGSISSQSFDEVLDEQKINKPKSHSRNLTMTYKDGSTEFQVINKKADVLNEQKINKPKCHSRNLTFTYRDSSTVFEVLNTSNSIISSSNHLINMPQQMPSIKSPAVLNKLQKPLSFPVGSLNTRKQLFNYKPPQKPQSIVH